MKDLKQMNSEKTYKYVHALIIFVKPIICILILGFLYLLFFQKFKFGMPCIFYKLTGYKCPGCGMTHAMAEIWEGNYISAMRYNALSLTVLPVVCIYLFYRYVRQVLKKREDFYIWEYIMLLFLLIVTLGYGCIRNQI